MKKIRWEGRWNGKKDETKKENKAENMKIKKKRKIWRRETDEMRRRKLWAKEEKKNEVPIKWKDQKSYCWNERLEEAKKMIDDERGTDITKDQRIRRDA